MILADKIIDLRKKNGWSQEELAEKLNVSRQSVSKWEGAQSVPDLNKILRMAEVFDVSTDYLLKDSIDKPEIKNEISTIPIPDKGVCRPVSMEEANNYLSVISSVSTYISLGVALCIISPVLLIVLETAQDTGVMAISETFAAGVGTGVLLILIATAVALFIFNGLRTEPYDYLERESIDTEYGVDGMVRERMEKYRNSHHLYIVLGVTLCIISVIPIVVIRTFNGSDFMVGGICAGILLILVALGTMLLIKTSMQWTAMQKLLEEGDYTKQAKEENRRNAPFSRIYWLTITAIYLLMSFWTGKWYSSWIIWPIAGIMFGVLITVLRMVRRQR